MKKILQLLSLLLFAIHLNAQDRTISGTVKEKDGGTLPGATVVAKGSLAGTTTDIDGAFSFRAPSGTTMLVVSYTGFASKEVSVPADGVVAVELSTESSMLGEVVISVGSRATQRTLTTSPLPIDILGAKDLVGTGQPTFDKALQYRVPSFNTVNTPVNDATSLLDPYEIRNMGPARTLVLINGKRKNPSSLVYIQTSPGRGEGGADLSSIPVDAIKRVEILRDGASAQYGSDAIAGVMNVILKDNTDEGTLNINTGMTAKGDGQMLGVSMNNGVALGEKGFLDYTIGLSTQAVANRPGKVDADGEYSDFVYANPATTDPDGDGTVTPAEMAATTAANAAGRALIDNFLRDHPDAGNINGQPATSAARFCVNGGIPVGGGNSDIYFNAAYVNKKVNSFANYRTPYWRTTDDGLLHAPGTPYVGYGPTFEGDLTDYNATVGLHSKYASGWKSDLSFTTGGNKQLYTVANSRNRGLGKNSPILFRPGGYGFENNIFNLDLTKNLRDNLVLGLGSEYRFEKFTIVAGDTASYATAPGADSFPGIAASNAGSSTRNNFGGYADLSWDVTEDFLLNGTARVEHYSDLGRPNGGKENSFYENAFDKNALAAVWKVSSRYKMSDDRFTIRASASTGFRAPSMQQTNLQIAQASFVPGQGIQTKGIFNNRSAQAKAIGVPQLKPEKSTNITFGLGMQPIKNLNLSLDYYLITVKDRIILGSEIGPTGDANNQLDKVLADNGIVAISFFTNGLNTITSGVDFVANYRGIMLGSGKLGATLSGNYTIQNEIDGGLSKVKNPDLIANAGKSVFDATQEALLFSSRPKYKAILGFDYKLHRFNANLYNTLFGPTTFHQAGLDANLNTEFKPAVVTDLGLSYDLKRNITFGVNLQNIFNVLPKWDFKSLNAAGDAVLADPAQVKTNSNLITFNQRYSLVTYDGSQFSQLGTVMAANLTFRF